jgi:cbb3-type cytochrome oxidase subunit 3
MSIVTSSSSSSPTIKGQSIGILLVEILVPLIVGISIIILLVLVILLVAVRVWRYKRGQGTMYSRLARGVITMDDESNDTL